MATQAKSKEKVTPSVPSHGSDSQGSLNRRKTSNQSLQDGFVHGKELLGANIEVLWFDEESGETWEKATVKEYNEYEKTHLVVYGDGDQEWYDLTDLKYRMAKKESGTDQEKGFLAKQGLVKTFSTIGMSGQALIGQLVEVYWTNDETNEGKWWGAAIKKFRKEDGRHYLEFDDGEKEWHNLEEVKYRILGTHHHHGHVEHVSHLGKEYDYADFGLSGTGLVGKKVEIFWHNDETPGAGPNDGQWFKGVIDEYSTERNEHHVVYEDGDVHWYALDDVRYRALDTEGLALVTERSEVSSHRSVKPNLSPEADDVGDTEDVEEVDDTTIDKHFSSLNAGEQKKNGAKSEEQGVKTPMKKGLEKTPTIRSPALSGVKIQPEKGLEGEAADDFEEEFLPGQFIPVSNPPQRETINDFLENIRNGEAVAEHEKDPSFYLQEFDFLAGDKEIIVGSITLEDVRLQEKKMEFDRLQRLRKEAAQYRRREAYLHLQEQNAKVRVEQEHKKRKEVIMRKRHKVKRELKILEQKLHRSFLRKKEALRENLEDQEGVVMERLGNLQERKDMLGLTMSMFGVNWKHIPQPVELHIQMARAVRDSVPNGRYVILLTLYNRLGGQPLCWTELGLSGGGVGLPGATEPVRHNGRYYDTELIFNESVFTVAPAQRDLRPTLTYVLELYQLGTSRWPDKVVAWSAFPAVDINNRLCSGRLKIPFLRGTIDRSIDNFSAIEETYCKDLDRWLFNVYLDVILLPKEVILGDGTILRDREIEMDYTRYLLSLRAPNPQEEASEEEANALVKKEAVDAKPRAKSLKGTSGLRKRQKGVGKSVGSTSKPSYNKSQSRKFTRRSSQQKIEDQKKKKGFKINTSLLDKYSYSLRRRGQKDVGSSMLGEAGRRIAFLAYEFSTEYNVRRCGSLDFWVSIFILLSAFYVRMFMHYIGQYIYLRICGVTVYRFTPLLYTVISKYNPGPLSVRMETGAVISGQIFNIVVFLWFMIVAKLIKHVLGKFPNILSKFLIGYGLGTVFDSLVTVLIDFAVGNYNCSAQYICSDITNAECHCMTGDAFKLAERFAAVEGTPIPGILLTFVLFVLLVVFSSILYYNYLLTLHFNGRVWDLYWRLSAYEDDFFLPDDLESLNCHNGARCIR